MSFKISLKELAKLLDSPPTPGTVIERMARCPTWVLSQKTYAALRREITAPSATDPAPPSHAVMFQIRLQVDPHFPDAMIMGVPNGWKYDPLATASERLVIMVLEGIE